MPLLLMIAAVGILLCGWLMLGQIDRFLQNGGLEEIPQPRICSDILLFGEDSFVREVSLRLEKEKISYSIVYDPDISENLRFQFVAALSGLDMDNLLLCSKARHICHEAKTIAVCNQMNHKTIFINLGIDCILSAPLEPDAILRMMKGCETE